MSRSDIVSAVLSYTRDRNQLWGKVTHWFQDKEGERPNSDYKQEAGK